MVVLKLPKEVREDLVDRLQSYVQDEFGESIGHLAADNLFQFVLSEMGPHVYNQAIRDARVTLASQFERLEEELYALEQPLTTRR